MFNRKRMFNRINSQDMDAYVEERLSDYLDGTLSDKERAIVQAHLATSERARASLDSLRYTVNLLKQTPAPVLPRQFTLPVTSRAPVNSTPGWLVWGLRGVGAAATAAFVILLVVNLTRPGLPSATLGSPQAAQEAVTAASSVALVPLTATVVAPAPNTQAYDANPTPIMLTEEPVTMSQALPVTETPTTAVQKSQPPQQDADTAQPTNPPPTALPAPAIIDTPIPQPTGAPAAGGAANNSSVPESSAATATDEFSNQRSILVVLEGQVTIRDLIVRDGPGIQYKIIGGLHLGDVVQVMGRSSDNNWLWVNYQRNRRVRQGWVSSAYIRLNGLVESVPVIEPGDLETPGPTPASLETEVPSDEGGSVKDFTPTPTPAQATPQVPVTPENEPTESPDRSPTASSAEGSATETPSPEATEPGRGGPAETPTE